MGERTETIRLTGLAVFGHHGVLDVERREGQPFLVDVVLQVPMPTTDDISGTVDYSVVADLVAEIVSGQPVDLIETLAMSVADRLASDPRVRRVEVTVHKPKAPIAVEFDDVSVTVEGVIHD